MRLTFYKKTLSIILMMLSPLVLFAEVYEGNVFVAYEMRDFENAAFKDDGIIAILGTKVNLDNSKLRAIYAYTYTNTKKPPKSKNLIAEKLALKYEYKIDAFNISAYYLNILDDNLAPTSDGVAYGLGATYNFNKKTSLGLTQFYSKYDKFKVHQSEAVIEYKTKLNGIKMKLSSITKYISIDKFSNDTYTKNAKDNYFTSGLTLHSHYNSYHFGLGSYFGSRTFAIMNDGSRVQHHALEFEETYAIGAGKTFSNFTIKMQYIYLVAKELPANNDKKVKVDVVSLMGNYKF